ncbi:LysE family translocator [Photobacterium lutimaris]|uniref:Lysine transporter LysE n=1 Tax=Photobacterium lutimaris TaxID=388278 RepID=A0A2T3IYF8_9GAMM|nr:LysE family translocator [Photobacterium lutimaris]PSU33630.1 lysine transporter LysE [Photobacterium lutimaris]TDR74520.1 threonine/homoserine/homoserine lactone efflux protein [Photobacterium lutimaris]
MDYIYSLVLFAVVSSATPGPNNILVMTSGLNFGIKKSLPVLCGICIGFSFMLLLVGFGFGQVFELFPSMHTIIKISGILYLLYLAWLISSSSGGLSSKEQSQPLTFLNGALFQWINTKAWVVATGAIAAFTVSGSEFTTQTLILASTFLIVSFPCVGIWLYFGSWLKKHLNNHVHRRWFNFSMSGLLVLSVLPVIRELLKPFV